MRRICAQQTKSPRIKQPFIQWKWNLVRLLLPDKIPFPLGDGVPVWVAGLIYSFMPSALLWWAVPLICPRVTPLVPSTVSVQSHCKKTSVGPMHA